MLKKLLLALSSAGLFVGSAFGATAIKVKFAGFKPSTPPATSPETATPDATPSESNLNTTKAAPAAPASQKAPAAPAKATTTKEAAPKTATKAQEVAKPATEAPKEQAATFKKIDQVQNTQSNNKYGFEIKVYDFDKQMYCPKNVSVDSGQCDSALVEIAVTNYNIVDDESRKVLKPYLVSDMTDDQLENTSFKDALNEYVQKRQDAYNEISASTESKVIEDEVGFGFNTQFSPFIGPVLNTKYNVFSTNPNKNDSATFGRTFDFDLGKVLSLTDLATEDKADELNELILNKFKETKTFTAKLESLDGKQKVSFASAKKLESPAQKFTKEVKTSKTDTVLRDFKVKGSLLETKNFNLLETGLDVYFLDVTSRTSVKVNIPVEELSGFLKPQYAEVYGLK